MASVAHSSSFFSSTLSNYSSDLFKKGLLSFLRTAMHQTYDVLFHNPNTDTVFTIEITLANHHHEMNVVFHCDFIIHILYCI